MLDLSKEQLCSILVFGNACFNIIVRINRDNVASRGAVGCTHTIIRFQTRIRRDDETENFEGFVYVLDGLPQRDFALWVFMYPINISPFRLYSVSILCLYPGYHAEGYHAPSIPHGLSRLYHLHGYHAVSFPLPRHSSLFYSWVITPELSRLSLIHI